MISSEVQRTLVKSPPELWAELSDPAALARHLGELGEIRITRTEPEKTVEWEAENTIGTVSIQPSGWGTRVKLSVTKKVEPDVRATEPTSEAPPELAPEPEAPTEPQSAAAGPELVPEPEAPTEPQAAAAGPELTAAEPKPAELAPEPRRGFFARLFGRKRKVEATEPQPIEHASDLGQPEPAEGCTSTKSADAWQSDPFAAVREALTPASIAAADLFAPPAAQPAPQDAPHTPETERRPGAQAEPVTDIAAELRTAEEVAEEEVTAVLAAVLDRLGAAHHRPFSRS
ncbi:MAG TPA: hypothetical protein VK680_01620 [Solirubrobacteraceae bacterium]|jgi:hypothetical protein|nr:hypothetical protein [Solirubrobacteraceae bacterium]